ncbi:nucleoside kinase [Caproiciproducens sp. NJN-50]|uniref:uridine kinase family protein n=1 Tax=Acutalibacteraceae TaxID=3082771 RepID=UPI000FFE1157|nr:MULTISPECIES: nucleoside kinase [Acutalibacteraceae]QAT49999.1 nucleoside kinase [Caproiciproducens sp. NJN-50]
MAAFRTDFVEYQNSVQQINRSVREDPEAFVAKGERAYHDNLRRIADSLAMEEPPCRLVMLAGPSASGKTTTAHLLAEALRERGTGAEIISLDDFYRGEHQAPLLPDGSHDYENVEALNVPEILECLGDLIASGRCNMPVFDFTIRLPYPHRRQVVLEDREIAIVEGIHALNPLLIAGLPARHIRRIYISVKQGIRDEAGELLGPNDMRLVRRIVRDKNFRGTRPGTTLGMWRNVMDGEYKYIKPFRTTADYTINSFHAHGPCVLKDQAATLLHTVPEDDPGWKTARMLLNALERFEPVDSCLVPKNSILREFIGGGIY